MRVSDDVMLERDPLVYLPSVFYNQAKVIFGRELDSSNDITGCSSIDTDFGYTALRAWVGQRCIQVASADSSIFKYEGLEVWKFRGSRLVGAPSPIQSIGLNISAVPRWIRRRITSRLRRVGIQ